MIKLKVAAHVLLAHFFCTMLWRLCMGWCNDFSNMEACQWQGEAVHNLFFQVWSPHNLQQKWSECRTVPAGQTTRPSLRLQCVVCHDMILTKLSVSLWCAASWRYSREWYSVQYIQSTLSARTLSCNWESCQFKSETQLSNSLGVYHTEAFKARPLSPRCLSGAAQVAGSRGMWLYWAAPSCEHVWLYEC